MLVERELRQALVSKEAKIESLTTTNRALKAKIAALESQSAGSYTNVVELEAQVESLKARREAKNIEDQYIGKLLEVHIATEDDWKTLMRRADMQAMRTAPDVFNRHDIVDQLWRNRYCSDSFHVEKVSPIPNDSLWISVALQLLSIASPTTVLTLAKTNGPQWELNGHHPAYKLYSTLARDDKTKDGPAQWAWKAFTQDDPVFVGNFGTLINRFDSPSAPLLGETSLDLWRSSYDGDFLSWQEFFDVCFGPVDVAMSSKTAISSVQPCVAGRSLPAYFTYFVPRLDPQFASELDLSPFPLGTFTARLRCEDGSLAAVRLRWAAGIYEYGEGKLRVVFDWADGSKALGMSRSGDWAADPPTEFERRELEGKVSLDRAVLLFRRLK